MMNFDLYRGHDASEVKVELEKLGYIVNVINNSIKLNDESSMLVVQVKQIGEKEIELICGEFTFLS